MNLNPFDQLDPITVVATVVIFAGTYAVLRKSVFVPLVTVMENRRERVDAGLDAAEEAYRLTSEAEARAAEVSELRREALDCVGLACEKLLVPVDKATAASIVDGVIAQRIH